MKLTVFLHFYQPYNQQEDILNRIVNECYLPLTEGLLKVPQAKVVANINGALSELLHDKGYTKVLDNFNELNKRGQVEYTGSAMYHAFLPLVPKEEVKRQIELNTKKNKKYLEGYDPVGFFSPEMAINDRVLDVVSEMGFKWIGAAQVAHPGDQTEISQNIFKDSGSGINVFFRNKRVSSLLLSGVVHDPDELVKETTDLHEKDKYWFTVMDAETFGHHRIGHEEFLFDVLSHNFIEPVTASDILNTKLPEKNVDVRPSTWTNEEQDFWLDKERKEATTDRSFILWKDPTNPIHKLQWELTNYVIKQVEGHKDKESKEYKKAREHLDSSIASDQFWWASAKPWWSLELIEQGAYELKMVLGHLKADSKSMSKAEGIYRKILDKAFEWQRTGHIRKRHLENSNTYMKEPFKDRTPGEWYNQIILEFDDEMKKAAENRDFEKAVKWRDAVLKLRQGTDMYDVLHVVDELWSARNIPEVKPFLEHGWNEFSDFAKESFNDVPDEETFEGLKKEKEELQKDDKRDREKGSKEHEDIDTIL